MASCPTNHTGKNTGKKLLLYINNDTTKYQNGGHFVWFIYHICRKHISGSTYASNIMFNCYIQYNNVYKHAKGNVYVTQFESIRSIDGKQIFDGCFLKYFSAFGKRISLRVIMLYK